FSAKSTARVRAIFRWYSVPGEGSSVACKLVLLAIIEPEARMQAFDAYSSPGRSVFHLPVSF
ncbi:MAG: hypothetical protein LCH39_00005, partial [Proteobacteria bacterium]|nr:hypothetical protein [Pseudomonadota bacterium]